ncbi:O-antigen/teichoic acid export membrane protein [Sphingomonas sp. SORGH_AS870]|nr:O-antigen/teichoic acid export membrane protein [Sphingomonas sp. SORGH_AS_0870]
MAAETGIGPEQMAALLRRMLRSRFVSLGIRTATLFLRFALSFYVVSYLGLEAAGIYGLAIGAIGIVPALLGWGLNYFVSRDVVGMTPDDAAPLVRDRLTVTILSLSLGTAVAIPMILAQIGGMPNVYLLILALLWLETLALDVYMPLVGLEMALQANMLVLVRSALWIPVAVGLGMISPSFRNLETVFASWIVSHFLAIALLFVFLRHWPVRAALSKRLDRAGMWMRIRNGWYIYLSDLGLVGLSYADRFILNAMLGLTATGIYSFYWSITNALYTLLSTAVVQLALPRMVLVLRQRGIVEWLAALRREVFKVLGFAAVLSVVIFIATEAIIHFAPPGRFPVARPLLVLMLVAAVLRACGDLLSVGLTSAGKDRVYAITNVGGVVLTVMLSSLCLWLFGLLGAGISAVGTALALCIVRILYLRTLPKRDPRAAQGRRGHAEAAVP